MNENNETRELVRLGFEQWAKAHAYDLSRVSALNALDFAGRVDYRAVSTEHAWRGWRAMAAQLHGAMVTGPTGRLHIHFSGTADDLLRLLKTEPTPLAEQLLRKRANVLTIPGGRRAHSGIGKPPDDSPERDATTAAISVADPQFSSPARVTLAALKACGMDRANHSYILSREQQQAHRVTAFGLKAIMDAGPALVTDKTGRIVESDVRILTRVVRDPLTGEIELTLNVNLVP